MTFEELPFGTLFHFSRDGSREGGEPPMMKVHTVVHEGDGERVRDPAAYADFVTGYVWVALPHEMRFEVEPWEKARAWWVLAPDGAMQVEEVKSRGP